MIIIIIINHHHHYYQHKDHRYYLKASQFISMYTDLDGGLKVYQAVEFVDNKPKPSGWKIGKMVQRAHKVMETDSSIYIVSLDICN